MLRQSYQTRIELNRHSERKFRDFFLSAVLTGFALITFAIFISQL